GTWNGSSSGCDSLPTLTCFFCPAPSTTLFPYTTLFRSPHHGGGQQYPHRGYLQRRDHRDGQGRHDPRHRRAHERREGGIHDGDIDRKSTRLNSSHVAISYAVFCLKKKQNDSSV